MALTTQTSLDNGPPTMKILALPALDFQGPPMFMQAAVVLLRPGGMLLAVPDMALTEEDLESFSQQSVPGVEPMIGPYTRVDVPIMDMDSQTLATEGPVPILLLDMDAAQAEAFLLDFQPEADERITAAPFIEGLLTYSLQYDLLKSDVLLWLIFLIQHGRLRSFAVEPPCTTFSAAAHPSLRSYRNPRGFCPQERRTWVGNKVAFAALCLLLVASHTNVFGLGEQPRRGKMAWLSEWQYLLSLANVAETFTASCSFGSIFQKEFRFITCNMVPYGICKPCTRDHEHVKIEGSLTKGSAVYCPGLVLALGALFQKHLDHGKALQEKVDLRTDGLESLFVNDVAKNAAWKIGSSWKWTGFSHINILELASAMQVVKKVARLGGGRFALLLDSFVALRALAKGRSASKALAPLLRKINALSVAFDCYPSGLFCPIRHNPSDDPTRSVPLREPCTPSPVFRKLPLAELYNLAELPKGKRWISNWASLILGLHAHDAFQVPSISSFPWRIRSHQLPIGFHEFTMDFDSTLGFPGEGPFQSLFLSFLSCPLLLPFAAARGWTFLCLVCVWPLRTASGASHGLPPRNTEDVRRAERRGSVILDLGRPVQPLTRSNRERLLKLFGEWCSARQIDLEALLQQAPRAPENLVKALTDYGKDLFHGGRPYSHYSETINAVGSKVPSVRRLLSGAWDFAFTWLREEPYEHHVACPAMVLLALVSTALVWGWPAVAGVLAISWSAITRIGEVTAALRKDLVLPSDVGYASASILLRIQEPKTRFRAARHQVAKADYEDMVRLISAVFAKYQPHQKLWPFSGQTLRTRFRQLLQALKLPVDSAAGGRALDLGSLRAGGATYLLGVREDSELVRRRGRWLVSRTMEIYLQEAAAITFYPGLNDEAKRRIMTAASVFPQVVDRATSFLRCSIPAEAWWLLMTDLQSGQMGSGVQAGHKPTGASSQQTKSRPKGTKRSTDA